MLVIGFGNPRQGDHGLGYQAAELLGGVACYRLTPDLALSVASTDRVIFLDARPADFSVREIYPAPETPKTGADIRPEELLAIARAQYGRTPRAWVVSGNASPAQIQDKLSETGVRSLHLMLAECDRISREEVVAGR